MNYQRVIRQIQRHLPATFDVTDNYDCVKSLSIGDPLYDESVHYHSVISISGRFVEVNYFGSDEDVVSLQLAITSSEECTKEFLVASFKKAIQDAGYYNQIL